MPVADDIAAYLATQSLGTVGTDIFVGFLPEEPDDIIILTDTKGRPPDITTKIEFPGLQIRIRNTAYLTAFAEARKINDLLHGMNNVTLSTVYYDFIEGQGSPLFVSKDNKMRTTFSLDFIVTKNQDPPA